MPFFGTLWLRLAIRELLNQKRFVSLFVVNLTVGLLSFNLIQSFQSGLNQQVRDSSKEIFTADVSLQTTSRHLDENELTLWASLTKDLVASESNITTLMAMSVSVKSGENRLVSVYAVDPTFPLYGTVRLDHHMSLPQDSDMLFKTPQILVPEDFAVQMQIAPGDELQLGQTKFKIAALITSDIQAGSVFSSFAPRVYIGKQHLEGTKLVLPDSRFTNVKYARWVPQFNEDQREKILQTLHAKSTLR